MALINDELIKRYQQWYKETKGTPLDKHTARAHLKQMMGQGGSGAGAVGPTSGMQPMGYNQPVVWSSATAMDNPEPVTLTSGGTSANPFLKWLEREAKAREKARREAETRAYDREKEIRNRQYYTQKDLAKEAAKIRRGVSKEAKENEDMFLKEGGKIDQEKLKAWKDTEINNRIKTMEDEYRKYGLMGETPSEVVAPAVNSNKTVSKKPKGKLIKTAKGDVVLSPTGLFNGKKAYEVYSQKKGTDTWEKSGVSLDETPTNFIPSGSMGTSKMRMDTFKTAYNTYKRDLGYTGEDGLGSNAVKERMKKEWGDDWEKTYLDKDGGAKQLYWDPDGGVTDTPPEVRPLKKDVEVQPEVPDAPMYEPEPDYPMYEPGPVGMMPTPRLPEREPYTGYKGKGFGDVGRAAVDVTGTIGKGLNAFKDAWNTEWGGRRLSPEGYEGPNYEPEMTPEDEGLIRQMEEEQMLEDRGRWAQAQGWAMAPENYNFEEGGDYGWY